MKYHYSRGKSTAENIKTGLQQVYVKNSRRNTRIWQKHKPTNFAKIIFAATNDAKLRSINTYIWKKYKTYAERLTWIQQPQPDRLVLVNFNGCIF